MSNRHRNRRDATLARLLTLAERADIIDEPHIQRVLTAAALSENRNLTQLIDRAIALNAVQHQPLDGEPPLVSPVRDRLSLGTTISGSTYALEQDDLTQHARFLPHTTILK